MPEVIGFLCTYADAHLGPRRDTHRRAVRAGRRTRLRGRRPPPGSGGARTVVLASGPTTARTCLHSRPPCPRAVTSLTAAEYRNPDQLDTGGVLVVGAAATGIQLADEIQRSGRPVTLAVGGHVRLPRVYRGMDIMWWLDASRGPRRAPRRGRRHRAGPQRGVIPARGLARARRPSTSTPSRTWACGSSGGLAGMTDDGIAQFSGSLPNQCVLADLKLGRLLDTLDGWATRRGLDSERPSHPSEFPPTRVPAEPAAAAASALRWGSRP